MSLQQFLPFGDEIIDLSRSVQLFQELPQQSLCLEPRLRRRLDVRSSLDYALREILHKTEVHSERLPETLGVQQL